MAVAKRGLGRGLDALLKGYQGEREEADARGLSIDAIRPNPNQPRRIFDEAALKELTESIRSQGVLQPVLVRPMGEGDEPVYELIAGERRWRAAKKAGLKSIPALVRNLSDEESLAIALIENLQREDLGPIEEALGLKRLQEQFGLNQEVLAEKIGKSRSAVANTLRLLNLPESIQGDLQGGKLTAGHARTLLGVADSLVQEELRRRILEEDLSVRQVEFMANHFREHGNLPDVAGAASSTGPTRRVRSAVAQDPEVEQVREQLASALELKVAVRGTPDKGQVVLAYASRAQLQGLLKILGITG